MRLCAGRGRGGGALAVLALVLAACTSTPERTPPTGPRPMTASEARALIATLLPPAVRDRNGWATDIFAAVAAVGAPQTPENFCAAIAVIGQESGFQADPPVPNLPRIAWQEIERQRERAGIPKLVLDGALALDSPDGRSYRERIDTVKTEGQLSDIFEDFIGMVPLGKRFLASRNPVRTGGPMQVSIAYAEARAREKPYPYPMKENVRREVFTRRGGVYFGVAHLFAYDAPYDQLIYRYADYNAGHYASRNAAFQAAVTEASGIPLVQDGDLLVGDGSDEKPSATELAVRVLAPRLALSNEQIRRDLRLGASESFQQSRLYKGVFSLVEKASGRTPPAAVLPQIELRSPKITRPLTTAWFANRVNERHRQCMGRVPVRD